MRTADLWAQQIHILNKHRHIDSQGKEPQTDSQRESAEEKREGRNGCVIQRRMYKRNILRIYLSRKDRIWTNIWTNIWKLDKEPIGMRTSADELLKTRWKTQNKTGLSSCLLYSLFLLWWLVHTLCRYQSTSILKTSNQNRLLISELSFFQHPHSVTGYSFKVYQS